MMLRSALLLGGGVLASDFMGELPLPEKCKSEEESLTLCWGLKILSAMDTNDMGSSLDMNLDMCLMYDGLMECYEDSDCFNAKDCKKFSKDMYSLMNAAGQAMGQSACKEYKCKCFPADGMVQLENGQRKRMDELQIGDKVLVGSGKYSEVYYFSTQLEESSSQFVSLQTADGSTLRLTRGHYLYVNGQLQPSSEVQVGDVLTLADGSSSRVERVSSTFARGLYNPHTLDGDIVVDGVLTSTYTTAVNPTLAHALLYPLRQMYTAGVRSFGEFSSFTKAFPSWLLDAVSV